MKAPHGKTSWTNFTDWFSDNVDNDSCKELNRMGALQAAPPGLIYYSETVPLYNEFANDIWDIVLQDGITLQELIGDHDFYGRATQFANFMVWCAAERLAFERTMQSRLRRKPHKESA